ncbi:MAG: FprA family A-type flavoprotein [Huintestinicola sp.]
MHCTRKVTDELTWTGADDRKLSLFEGVYPVHDGMSYNSYLLSDEKTVLFDTADKAVTESFLENIRYTLSGRKLDYIIVHHAEPDHSASLAAVLREYPDAEIVCTAKCAEMLGQFTGMKLNVHTVAENDTLSSGKHVLRFITAPMVHWPEVMVTYDETDKVLFSADAFGTFGALNGALFADEVDFERDFLPEARRYYCNIVGKFGMQVQMLLKKASALDIKLICPLHGYVWRKNIELITEKYNLWSTYQPEEKAVVIAYASIYGGTEKAANITACMLRDRGVKTKVMDMSVHTSDELVAECFRASCLVFATPTYNGGIFIKMEEALRNIAAHGIKNRTCAFIQNGTWMPMSAKLMREILSSCKDMTFIDDPLTVKSVLTEEQFEETEAFVNEIASAV